MCRHIHNITLSTHRSDVSGYELIDIVEKYNGILIPAHCFTPFKSYYGNCVDRMKDIFKEKFDKIFSIELGLSADTYLADMITELEDKTFVTNSDAHSLPKIARDYNILLVNDISFKEVVKALKGEDWRKVLCNYGLDPKLGKYHRTFCDSCNQVIETKEPVAVCPFCGSDNVTFGVFDRIELIKDKEWIQISEKKAIKEVVLKVLENNPQSVADYKAGKDRALGFLVGQAMKETKGKANPQMLNKLFLDELNK